jgi:hypothetical protein
MCPHTKDFFENKTLKEYYERDPDNPGRVSCKICREVLLEGTSGITEEDLGTTYDRELKSQIWKDIQIIKRYVSFQKVSDAKGNNRNLDNRIINYVYDELYAINAKLSKIKSLSTDMVKQRQTFFNHIYILIVFLMLEYPVAIADGGRNSSYENQETKRKMIQQALVIDGRVLAYAPVYKTRREITVDEVAKFIMRLDTQILRNMNQGEQQVKATFTDAAAKMNENIYGKVEQIIHPMLAMINNNTFLRLFIHGSSSTTEPVLNEWSDAETQRVFKMSLKEIEQESFMTRILHVDASDKEFEHIVERYPVYMRGWIRWHRKSIKYENQIRNYFENMDRIPDELLKHITVDYMNTDPDNISYVSEKSKQEYQEYKEGYEHTVKLYNSRPQTMTPKKRWTIHHAGALNTTLMFNEKGDKRSWSKYVYYDEETKKEYILTLDDLQKKPRTAKLIDRIDKDGVRWSELLDEGEIDKKGNRTDMSVKRRREDWLESLSIGKNENYFTSEASKKTYNAIKQRRIHVDFMEYEVIRLQNEGKEVKLDVISTQAYFDKHSKEFLKSKWRNFDRKNYNKMLKEMQKEKAEVLHGAVDVNVFSKIKAEELYVKLSANISKIATIMDIDPAYLWELGNLKGRKYEDIPGQWGEDVEQVENLFIGNNSKVKGKAESKNTNQGENKDTNQGENKDTNQGESKENEEDEIEPIKMDNDSGVVMNDEDEKIKINNDKENQSNTGSESRSAYITDIGIKGTRKNNNRFSPLRIATIRGAYAQLHRLSEVALNYHKMLIREKEKYRRIKSLEDPLVIKNIKKVITNQILENLTKNHQYFSPILNDIKGFESRIQQIFGALYVFTDAILVYLTDKSIELFGKEVLQSILYTDRDNCIPSAITYVGMATNAETTQMDADGDINIEFNERKDNYISIHDIYVYLFITHMLIFE